jgi:DNA-binding transcriptional LysR family regulator
MDLVDLELIIAVADAGSITHGAARAHLSLPSASARIRGLERTVGAPLFERGRRGVSPTATGTLLLRHAHEIRHAFEQMRTEIAEHADDYGCVRVMANTAATTSLLAPAVATFLTTHRRARVDVEEGASCHIATAVAERRAELGIVTSSVDLGGLETRNLRADPLVVVTAPDDPITAHDAVSYSEIVDRPFVGHSRADTFPLGARPTYRARMPTIDAMCQAVSAGLGVAIVPLRSIEKWIASGSIAVTQLEDQWADRQLAVCFVAENQLSPTARALRDHLGRHYEQLTTHRRRPTIQHSSCWPE